MKEKKSLYRCEVCSWVIKAEAGQQQICKHCGVAMREANKGIINK